MATPCAAFSALGLSDSIHLLQADSRRQEHTVSRDIRPTLTYVVRNHERTGGVVNMPAGLDSKFCTKCEFCLLVRAGVLEIQSQMLAAQGLKASGCGQVEFVFKKVEFGEGGFNGSQNESSNTGTAAGIGSLSLIVLKGDASYERTGLTRQSSVALPLEVFAEEGDEAARVLNIYRRPLSHHVLSEDNVEKIRFWLEDCNHKHERCRKESSDPAPLDNSPLLPSRLIYVGNEDRGEHIRLVLTSSISGLTAKSAKPIKYIALSYCWGDPKDSAPPLSTSTETFRDRVEMIPPDILPQAYRDVISVARALHIQYIWIDSLCIIQDSLQDWQIESAKMNEVYTKAYFTVIAAAGTSSHDGFLQRSYPRLYCTVELRTVDKTSGSGSYHLRRRAGEKWWGTDRMAEISGKRWIERGWTFQEERLSRRVLMFGENKFFWDCRTLERTEDTNLFWARPDWSETLFEAPEDEDHRATTKSAPRMKKTAFDNWQTLCNHYSKRTLTFAKDKLPAFSGIARQIADRVHCTYLAGLWRDHLAHDLFWQTLPNAQKPPHYLAPSWSWAAIDGEVRWKNWLTCIEDGCSMYCTIIDAQTKLDGPDPFGAVKGGYLRVLGVLFQVQIEWNPDARRHKLPWRVVFDAVEIAKADLDFEKTEPPQEFKVRKVTALLVAKCTTRDSPPRGLLLQGKGRGRDGISQFERLGVFRIYPEISPGGVDAIRMWEQGQHEEFDII